MARPSEPCPHPSHFIPGIYNYCDRWCARCPFSERCRVYEVERRAGADPDRPSDSLAHSVQILQTSFEEASQRLQHLTTSLGVTFDLAVGGEAGEECRSRELEADPLARDATTYSLLVHEWLRAEAGPLLEHVTALGASGVSAERVSEALFELREHLTVVSHDHWLIASKTRRAIVGALLRRDLLEEPVWPSNPGAPPGPGTTRRPIATDPVEGDDEIQSDENGSAKVALLAIGRSREAWRGVASHYPGGPESVPLLVDWLDRLRAQLETRFPRALAFRRPGFDGGSA